MDEKLRMCVVCRQMQDKRSLLRVVKDKEGNISVDATGKKNGRGAYICKSEDCINKMLKQKSFNRAFKTNISDEVYQSIKGEIFGQR